MGISYRLLRTGINRNMTPEQIEKQLIEVSGLLHERLEPVRVQCNLPYDITQKRIIFALMQDCLIVEGVSDVGITTGVAFIATGMFWLTDETHANVLLLETYSNDKTDFLAYIKEIAKARNCDKIIYPYSECFNNTVRPYCSADEVTATMKTEIIDTV